VATSHHLPTSAAQNIWTARGTRGDALLVTGPCQRIWFALVTSTRTDSDPDVRHLAPQAFLWRPSQPRGGGEGGRVRYRRRRMCAVHIRSSVRATAPCWDIDRARALLPPPDSQRNNIGRFRSTGAPSHVVWPERVQGGSSQVGHAVTRPNSGSST